MVFLIFGDVFKEHTGLLAAQGVKRRNSLGLEIKFGAMKLDLGHIMRALMRSLAPKLTC